LGFYPLLYLKQKGAPLVPTVKQLKKHIVKITRAKLVEFGPTATSQQQYYFPDLNDIRNANIFGMEAYGGDNLTKTYGGNNPIADADLDLAYVNLYFDGGNFLNIPLIRMIQTKNNATTGTNAYSQFPFLMAGQVVEWSKSFVWFGSTASLTTNRYFQFNIYYTQN
jgi:hypothetical protein